MPNKIRVVIVDDSALFREYLSRALSADPALEVVERFADPVTAIAAIGRLRPDVMTVDMEMPRMRGDEFMRTVLPKYPKVRAVVISALSSNVFDAMQAGAIDFVGKPNPQAGYSQAQFAADIIQKIKIAALATPRSVPRTVQRTAAPPGAPVLPRTLARATARSLIAIGASTGGTEAILEVIKKFPASTPGVVIVQHMPPVFTKMYADRMDKICQMNVREAKNGDRAEPGVILIAPGGEQQMRIRRDANGYYVSLITEAKVSGHCPSANVLFESVAEAAGRNAVGVLLTGMGADGAEKLLKMREAGAHTIGQDKDTCVVYGMPKVAYEIGAVAEQLPVSAIGDAVLRRFS